MKFFVFILLLAFNFTTCAFAQDNTKFDEMDESAVIAMDSGRYDDAISIYKKLVENNYEKSYSYSQLGLCYFYLENYAKAKGNFKLAALYDENPDATKYANIAAAYNHMNEFDMAMEYTKKALDLEVNSQTVTNAISIATNSGKYNQTEVIYDKYVKDNETLADDNAIKYAMARAYFKQHKYNESIKFYEKFFDSYTPNENFPVDIKQEKETYLNAMVYRAVELSSNPEIYEGQNFLYDTEIKQVFEELSSEYGFDETFPVINYLGHHIVMNNPLSSTYFKILLWDYARDSFFEKVTSFNIVGDHSLALMELENNRDKNFDESLSEKARQQTINANIYITKLFIYVRQLILKNNTDQDLQNELLELASEIFPKTNQEDFPAAVRTASTMTEVMLVSLLHRFSRTDQDEFLTKLMLSCDVRLDENKAKKIIRLVRDTGKFQ